MRANRPDEYVMRVPFTEEQRKYLDACARLRGASLATLLRKLIHVIADDQLVIGILDDEPVKEEGVRTHRPSSDLFSGVRSDPIIDRANAVAIARTRSPSVPTRTNRSPTLHKRVIMATRSELQAELAEAVRNTASLPVE